MLDINENELQWIEVTEISMNILQYRKSLMIRNKLQIDGSFAICFACKFREFEGYKV